jgi:para-nitrobenzyl esterase
MNDSKTIESQLQLHGELLDELGIDSLDKLLAADPDWLVAESCAFTDRRKIPNLLFAPVIHTDLLPDSYEALAYGGKVKNIPCLIGCTRNDMTAGDDVLHSLIFTGCTKWALAAEKAGHAPNYVYLFDRAPLGGEGQGAFHSSDLWYSFHTLSRSWREKEPVDYAIADEMNRRWADFIKTGSPNDETLAPWQPYTAAQPDVHHFG